MAWVEHSRVSPQFLLSGTNLGTTANRPFLGSYPSVPPLVDRLSFLDSKGYPIVTSFGNDPLLKSFSEIYLPVAWDRGERAANGLRRSQRGEYGKYAHRAMNNPFLSQHNHEHGRRVERHLEVLLATPELHTTPLPAYLIYAAALFPYLHDSDQLDTEQRNIDDKSSLIPKQAHGLAAGLKILAQTEEYAKAANLPLDEARKITGAAAFMMIKHDEPAKLLAALKGTQRMPQDTDGKALANAYDDNLLDLASLPVNQLVKIVLSKKSEKMGFISAPETTFGLHPLFEKEYAKELEALAKDPSPLIPDFDESDHEGLNLLTQACVFADMFDMIMPAEEAIVRKLGVDKSLKRPFYRPEITPDLLNEQLNSPSGHFEPEVGSDLARMLWELEHPLDIDPNSIIAQSTYVQNLIGETVIKGALSFRELGTSLMQDDFSVLERIYDRRINALKKKVKNKYGYDKPNGRVDSLAAEMGDLFQRLKPKFKKDGELVYSTVDISMFQSYINTMLVRLQNRYQITDSQIETFQNDIREGNLAGMPFKAYDSSSEDFESEGPRTIFEYR